MNIIRKLISVFEDLYNHSSNSRFCRYLLKKGIKMGGQNSFRPHSTVIDFTRPSLITIGSNSYT